jgi:anthranilate phosphoribosyltransferase
VHPAVIALLSGQDVRSETWRSYWDDLESGLLDRDQSVALLASLATTLPRSDTLAAFIASLDERRPTGPPPVPGCVNVVGTGGGPSTFNLSTAASVVAAAMGVPVVKTGSRAYASQCGSLDILGQLGIRLTASTTETLDVLSDVGIAFAGTYVYPNELVTLARQILPLGLKLFGRFMNAVGPFLAAVPVAAQVTGVSDLSLVGPLRRLAPALAGRALWLIDNDCGVDELLGFTTNRVYPPVDGGLYPPPLEMGPGTLTTGEGTLDDVAPVARSERIGHFLDVLSGTASPPATAALTLNAAALAVASGQWSDWPSAVSDAAAALRDGAAIDLVRRLRERGVKPLITSGASGAPHG